MSVYYHQGTQNIWVNNTAVTAGAFQPFWVDVGTTATNIVYNNWIPIVNPIPEWQNVPVTNIQWGHCSPDLTPSPEKVRERNAAIERGRRLLKEFLSEAEFAALYDTGIWIDSKLHPDRKYLVKPDTGDGTIRVYEGGKDVGWMCIHALNRDFIQEDVILARLMLLEFNEAEFDKVAVYHRVAA